MIICGEAAAAVGEFIGGSLAMNLMWSVPEPEMWIGVMAILVKVSVHGLTRAVGGSWK